MDYQYKGAFSTDIIEGKEVNFLKNNIYDLNPNDKKVQKLINSKYLIAMAKSVKQDKNKQKGEK